MEPPPHPCNAAPPHTHAAASRPPVVQVLSAAWVPPHGATAGSRLPEERKSAAFWVDQTRRRSAVREQELTARLARERALNTELRANRAALAKQSERLLRLAQEFEEAKEAEAAGCMDDIKAANDRLRLERENTAKLEARRAARRVRLAGPNPNPPLPPPPPPLPASSTAAPPPAVGRGRAALRVRLASGPPRACKFKLAARRGQPLRCCIRSIGPCG